MHEQEGDNEPAHHARRPMNAFLIFCKRHRSVVRDKYPNLENRSITKILGEWWANLDKEEKSCYTSLAKQYKDAFFSANPDFKWYKLPAPPLRSISSRPRETNERHDNTITTCTKYHTTDLERTNNNSTKIDLNITLTDHEYDGDYKSISMFTPGKLADEAQMGGISSLLSLKTETETPNPYYSPPSYKFTAISASNERSHFERNHPKCLSTDDNIQELQNALSETTRIFKEDFEDGKGRIYYYEIPNDQLTNQDVINQVVDKRFYRDDDDSPRNFSDDEKNTKSGRSCKGKKYQEFMAVGGFIVNKRQKKYYYDRTSDESYSASASWDPRGSLSEEQPPVADNDVSIETTNLNTTLEIENLNETTDTLECDSNSNKTFKAADFDLDAKIKALPSLSLEKFQQKKRENKRKKKTVNLKPKDLTSSEIVNSVPMSVSKEERRAMVEKWRDNMIGSQKRKPRKISITRLEVNNMVSSVNDSESQKINHEIKIATEAPPTIVQNMDICKPLDHTSIDLFALATLAEVAANESKLEAREKFNAKTSEMNASKV